MSSQTVPLPVPPARRLTRSHRWKVLGVGVAANASVLAAVGGIPTTAVWMRTGYHLDTAQVGLAVGAAERTAFAEVCPA